MKRAGAGLFGLGAASLMAGVGRAATRGSSPGIVLPSPSPAPSVVGVLAARRQVAPTPSNALGPNYVANMPVRSDIVETQQGLPLRLFCRVINAVTEAPISGATVDAWQANACGIDSGFAAQGTAGQTFLRGVQPTAADGRCWFDTVFPGWYQGTTAHIHA